MHRIYQWLLDPDGDGRTADAPQVVNNSWGLAGTTDQCNVLLARVWQAMALADVAVVFAAGNDGPHERTSMSPANNPGVVSVGALDADGAVSRQSSRGPSACDAAGAPRLPFPTLHAPGIALPALDRIGASAGVAQRSDGTSFAAAVASGTLLLLRQREPEWSVAQLVAALAGQAVAAAPGLPPSVHAGALAAAPAERPRLQVLRPADGRLDAPDAALRAAACAGSARRIEPASPGSPCRPGWRCRATMPSGSRKPAGRHRHRAAPRAVRRPARLPLRVMQPAAPTTASAGAEARVFAARRDAGGAGHERRRRRPTRQPGASRCARRAHRARCRRPLVVSAAGGLRPAPASSRCAPPSMQPYKVVVRP
ncbi:MAG: S8 family serine peptidase [Rubrivivax sp.]